MTRSGVQEAIVRLCDRAEITEAKGGAHTFRHTFATSALKNGADRYHVQLLLGQSTSAITEKYTQMVNSSIALDRHDTFSPVEHMVK
jgi:site-specific recombinase XerD